VEIFRFVIFFVDCYYFCSKSSKLLPNKEKVKWILQLIFGFLFLLSLGFMAYVFWIKTADYAKKDGPDEIENMHLC